MFQNLFYLREKYPLIMKRILFIITMLGSFLAACQGTREEKFAREAQKLTKQCPMVMDGNTDLDSLIYDQTNSLYQYYYSLHGFNDEDFTTLIAHPSFIERIKENVVNSVEMKPYKDAGLTFVYRYYSKSSKALLGSIEVTPEEYTR